jgi:glycosyltransferase involved in cell wall biosynthesis
LAEPLKILHVVRSPVGGIFRHIGDLVAAQSAEGHRVGLILDSLTGGAFEAAHIARLAPDLALGAVRLPMPRSIGPADAPALVAVSRQVHRLAPDVIHSHGAKGGVFGRLAAAIERRRGRKVAAFYAPHGGSLHYDGGSAAGRIFFAVERALERATDGLIHVSAYEARTYRDKIGVPRCPAHVVVNGLRPEEFEPVATRPDAADLLYIGMLRDLKGVDVFLEALALIKGEGATALVVGAGDPADEARYRKMVAAAGLADKVAFRPPMPAREAFAAARVIAVPSRAESMPYIVLEAVAAGLPLVATHVGGIPEIVDADELVPPGDARALAEALRRALRDPERAAAAAMLRRDRIREKFSLESMAARVEDIYRGALDRRYRTACAGTAAEARFSR